MKRRLQLMPEVLPAPNKTATSAVRERTMARLRVLAAVGTGIAAACGGSTATPSGGGGSSGGSSGNGPDGGLPDANKPDSDPGYGVVDPLPPPACFDYATPPTATAKFVDHEAVGVDALQEHDARRGRSVRARRRQGHRVGLMHAGARRVGKPTLELLDRIVARVDFEEAVSSVLRSEVGERGVRLVGDRHGATSSIAREASDRRTRGVRSRGQSVPPSAATLAHHHIASSCAALKKSAPGWQTLGSSTLV